MKTKQQKRNEALARLQSATYANSKAKRLGTKTEAQWEAERAARIEALGG